MPDINKFLTDMKANSTAEVSTQWAKVEELYNKKLWHQLTKLLQDLIKEKSLQVRFWCLSIDSLYFVLCRTSSLQSTKNSSWTLSRG